MSRRKKQSHDEELPFVALMDTMTNVVGVLIIVLVMIGISLANSVRKVLSELPPVTVEQLQEILKKVVDATPKEDPKKLAEEKKKLEEQITKANEDLKTLDLSSKTQNIKLMDLDEAQVKLDAAKKDREVRKTETDKLSADVDKLKALLDTTPVYAPAPPTVVKLPNPRPYPENPNQVDYFVAESRVTTFVPGDYLPPIAKGLEQIRSQLEFRDPKLPMFEKMLMDILNKDRARVVKAWAAIAPLAPHIQVESLALAWDTLSKTGAEIGKDEMQDCVNLALGRGKTVSVMANAMAAAARGDFAPWIAFRPAAEKPETPSFIGQLDGSKVTIGYTTKYQFTVRNTPKDVLKAFGDVVKALNYQQKYREKTIYDPDKLKATLVRAFASSVIPKDFQGEVVERPSSEYFTLKFIPRPETSETIDQALLPNSKFRRGLASVKGSPEGVVWFKVLRQSLGAYVRAREVAEEIEVPAGWEIVEKDDISTPFRSFEIPKREYVIPAKPGTTPTTIKIAPPTKTLD